MSTGETLSEEERARLAPFVSDLDAPVFALLGLPETTRGALFARYSRYPGTLRRLMLDEFGAELDDAGAPAPAGGGTRSRELYERVLGDYGDDSVAQLAGVHVACEWVSNVLTKILQRPRLGAYLEQSTRYIAYDTPVPGLGYRYHRDPELGPGYERAMDELFGTYSRLRDPLAAWLEHRFPASGGTPGAHAGAVRAKSLDLLRGLLPAAALSHVGIFASAQTYERLIMHLRAHDLPEARRCGELLLSAVRAAAPAFVVRVERPDRGGEWSRFLQQREQAEARAAGQLGLSASGGEEPAGVRLLRAEGDEQLLLAALVFERSRRSEDDALAAVAALGAAQRGELLAGLLGGRGNRRHLPGRGLESLRYRFEVVSDYGAFRDLQRHRMLTVQWQALGPHLGAEVPEEVGAAGLAEDYARALERSREAWAELDGGGRRPALAVRPVPGASGAVRAGHGRARGDARDRAALGRRGARLLPADRPSDARADRGGPPRRGSGDAVHRHERGAATRAARSGGPSRGGLTGFARIYDGAMHVPARLLTDTARLPARAHDDDAAFDLCADEAATLAPGERATVGTGVALALPAGSCGLVLPRSGLAARHGVTVLNAPGLIDPGYRGELKVVLLNTDPRTAFAIEPGDRIAQLLVIEPGIAALALADGELGATSRGEAGFGSTGR